MFGPRNEWIREVAILCCVLVVPGDVPLMAQQAAAPAAEAAEPPAAPIPADQLDSLVAPIALYPDPLLAQVLAASTYPLEIVQLRQWLDKHKDLKDKALADAVKKENWDPSIQSMAALPDVVKQMEENIKWTSELGNAFLAQESGVMDAVQRMRAKAKDSGKLTSNEQMKVETKVVESKTVVVIEQSNPQVVYVPSYDPVVVWGVAPVYAYPPIVYPAGYYAAGVALSFGVGLAMGAMWGGGWGYGCGWGGNNTVNINNNNNFNRNSNRTNNIGNGSGNRGNGNRGNGGNWSHNPQHRGGAPYGDRSTANKFGGTTRGDSASNRQASARQNAGQRGGAGGVGGGAGSGNSFRSNSGAGGGAGGAANRGSSSVGNRQASGSGGSRGSSSGAFGGGGSSGSSARSSSSRGSSSMGGGGSRGGGGGGSRGGGGGGRRR